ncbi:MAG: hypothetical protein HY390_08190 [Deltaproteobacteria bacterium]|nr:hypothetical protein [Deltaproteobacteria bacterium]
MGVFKRFRSLPLILLFTFVGLSSAWTYAPPIPNTHEAIALTLSATQLSSLISKENYSAPISEGGVCYGMDRVNYTLLTQIKFERGQKRSPHHIANKIISAFQEKRPQVITGFSSTYQFVSQMQREWTDTFNPLKYAIETIQGDFDRFRNAVQIFLNGAHLIFNGIDALYETVDQFQSYILASTPVPIVIISTRTLGAHALTIVGFKKDLSDPWNSLPRHFLVLDSNYPQTLQVLEFKYNHWFYEPWQSETDPGVVFVYFENPSRQDIDVANQHFKVQWLTHRDHILPFSP